MDAVSHVVRSQGAFDLLNDSFVARELGKRQRAGGALEPIEMLAELENPTVIKPHSFPHCVAALHTGIKRTDRSLVSVYQQAVDVYQNVAITFVVFLQHSLSANYTSSLKEKVTPADALAQVDRPLHRPMLHPKQRSCS